MSRLILPGDPRFMRERTPPKAPFGARLQGRLHWQLVGRDGKVKQEGEQSNLVLDSGLDHVASYSIVTNGGAGVARYAAVGTGSTAPATSQTGLDSEIARTSTLGVVSYPGVTTETANGVFEHKIDREFGFAEANGNLTEWGFSPGSAGTSLFCRELFRDGSNNPITVTKTSSEKLRLTYTLTITFTPVTAQAANFTITDLGAKVGTFCVAKSSASLVHNLPEFFSRYMRALVGTGTDTIRCAYTSSRLSPSYAIGLVTPSSYATPTFSAFVSGTWERTISFTADTGSWNATNYSWTLAGAEAGGTIRVQGYVFSFDVGEQFVKDNLHTLSVDLFTITWSR